MMLMARFDTPEALVEAMRQAAAQGMDIVDAYTPFPVAEIAALLPDDDRGLRATMLVAGFVAAAAAYGLEWYSATLGYPINSGGRPLHSWPVFLLFPFELGILAAAIAGLVLFLFRTGLPLFHDPVFENELLKTANTEGFLLALAAPESETAREKVVALLMQGGAQSVQLSP